jgi:large subunit ribosomal protein L17
MRHAKAGRRLGRKTSHRIAMFRNMVTSFFDHEKITTTDAKAREIRPIAEKLITLGKRGDLHARRLAASYIRDPKTVAKLFTQIAPRYQERDGGYTRIIKLGIRPGDNAEISLIELVEEALVKKAPKKMQKKIVEVVPAAPVVTVPMAEAEPVVEAVAEEAPPLTAVVEGEEACEAKTD